MAVAIATPSSRRSRNSMDLYPQLRQITDLPSTFLRNDPTFAELMAAFAAALTLGTSSNTNLLQNTNYQAADNGWIDVWGDLAGITRRFQEADGSFHTRLPDMLLAARDSPVAIELWLSIVEGVAGTVSQQLPAWGYKVNLPATLPNPQVQQIIDDLAYVRPAGMPFSVNLETGGTYISTVNYFGSTQSHIVASGAPQLTRSPWNFGGRVTGSWLYTQSPFNDQFSPIFGGTTSGVTYISTVNYLGASKYFTERPSLVSKRQPWNFGGRVTGAWLASKKQTSAFDIPCATNNQVSLLPDLLLTDSTLNQG